MDNFYYRYLETTETKNLTTSELAPHVWGAFSFEGDLMVALKNKQSAAFPGIKEMAKSIPRAQQPKVRFGLWAEVAELTVEHGKLILKSEINWGFPDYTDPAKALQKVTIFEYDDLARFRKELALKLEDVCELFL